MRQRFHHITAAACLGIAMTIGWPADAGAQSVGLGARLSSIRGDLKGDGSRFTGGVLQFRTSTKTAVELSIDYRNHLNESLTARVKDYPIMASLQWYPANSTLAPYLLGGFGWYNRRIDVLEGDNVLTSTKTRETGFHAGLGGELRFGRRAAFHVDYRYTLIGYGRGDDTEAGVLPIPGLGGLQDKLNLSHKGSMWTSGVTVYF